MKEFIEREAIYKSACTGCTRHGEEIGSCFSNEPCEKLNFAFTTAPPAADVVERKRGEWIVCGDGGNVPWMCSHCGKTTAHKYKVMYGNFCPNCGCDMRGDTNDHH